MRMQPLLVAALVAVLVIVVPVALEYGAQATAGMRWMLPMVPVIDGIAWLARASSSLAGLPAMLLEDYGGWSLTDLEIASRALNAAIWGVVVSLLYTVWRSFFASP